MLYALLSVLFSMLDLVILSTYVKFSNRLKDEKVQQVSEKLALTETSDD